MQRRVAGSWQRSARRLTSTWASAASRSTSSGRWVTRLATQEKLRVAEALEQLPLIAGALEQGSLHWSCARELTRVAIPETEEEWLDASRGKTRLLRRAPALGTHRERDLVAGPCRTASLPARLPLDGMTGRQPWQSNATRNASESWALSARRQLDRAR
jgi:hypothetical protein